MKVRQLGNTKLRTSEIGLGCMELTAISGQVKESDAIAMLERAVSLGINFLDTADIYGFGANEALLAKAFTNHWSQIILATKFGLIRSEQNPNAFTVNGHPDYVKSACDASLKRLQIDVIDLYYLHRKDKNVPFEDTIGAMAELVKVGKVRYLGLSEVSAQDLKKAHEIHPITALQSAYSLWRREPEKEILSVCEDLSISFIAYSPLGKAMFKQESLSDVELLGVMDQIALKKKCTRSQLALAWILAKSSKTIPIPGTMQQIHVEENAAASEIELATEEVAALDKASNQASINHDPNNTKKFIAK